MSKNKTEWHRTKKGGLRRPGLPVRSGVGCDGLVQQNRDGKFAFVLIGRKGKRLCNWHNGFGTEKAAMIAAENRASETDNP